MNAQTPGPLHVTSRPGYLADSRRAIVAHVPHSCGMTDDGAIHMSSDAIRPTAAQANARLLAASFNAFDKAGRALGIDAATLAERVDLAALIIAARQASALLDAVIVNGHCSTFADITHGPMGNVIEPANALRGEVAKVG